MAKIYETHDEFIADIIQNVLTRFRADFTQNGIKKKILDEVSLSILHFQLVSQIPPLISQSQFEALKAKATAKIFGDEKCMENCLKRLVGNLSLAPGTYANGLKERLETGEGGYLSGICQYALESLVAANKTVVPKRGLFALFFSRGNETKLSENDGALFSLTESFILFSENMLQLRMYIVDTITRQTTIDTTYRNTP